MCREFPEFQNRLVAQKDPTVQWDLGNRVLPDLLLDQQIPVALEVLLALADQMNLAVLVIPMGLSSQHLLVIP